jgi:hypothetical protein
MCVSVDNSLLSLKDEWDSWTVRHLREVPWLMILVVFWMLEGDVKELCHVGHVVPDESSSHATS